MEHRNYDWKKKKKSDIIEASGPFQRNRPLPPKTEMVQSFQNGRLQIKNCFVFDQFTTRGFFNCFKSSMPFCLSSVFYHQEGFDSICIFICLSEPTPDRPIFMRPHEKGTGSTFESHYSSEKHFTVELSVTQTPTRSSSWGRGEHSPVCSTRVSTGTYPRVPFPDMGGLGGFCVGGLVRGSPPPPPVFMFWALACRRSTEKNLRIRAKLMMPFRPEISLNLWTSASKKI